MTRRFDTIAKLFAQRKSSKSYAQEATPAATRTARRSRISLSSPSRAARIAPKEGEDGTYTVTLEHGLGQTLYFADRPSRDVGAVPTEQFLRGLGFPDDNPPNAALVVDDGAGGTEIAVVELRNPATIDPTVPSVTYDVTVLEDVGGLDGTGAPGGAGGSVQPAAELRGGPPLHRRLRRRLCLMHEPRSPQSGCMTNSPSATTTGPACPASRTAPRSPMAAWPSTIGRSSATTGSATAAANASPTLPAAISSALRGPNVSDRCASRFRTTRR